MLPSTLAVELTEITMRRTVLKSKIHRAIVTETNIHYEGSLSIDADLLDAADILPFEQIHVWDVTNGSRIITYAILGERGTGIIQVNGGGTHHIKKGDVVIIATFTDLKSRDAKKHKPRVIFVDRENHVKEADDRDNDVDATEDLPAAPPVEPVAKPRRTRKRKPSE